VQVRVFDHDDVERLLPMRECIEVVEDALKVLDRGEYAMPLRSFFTPPGAPGGMAWMPGYRSGPKAVFGMKVLVVIPDNPSRGLDGHQGAVLLLDGETGRLRALLDASAVTAIRTAATTAVATRLLSRPESSVLGIIGTGVQARKHCEAIPLVRPIRKVIVAGRDPFRAQEFVASLAPIDGVTFEAAVSIEEAVSGADIVATCTSSRDPFVRREWLRPGLHLNAVGASRPPSHEPEPAVIPAVALFSDRRESLDGEATEWKLAQEQGLVGPSHFRGELGQILNGKLPGRTSPDEITVFRSLGLSVEDVASAQYVLANAEAAG